MNSERLVIAALAAGVAFLAAEVRRSDAARDVERARYDEFVARMAEKPETVLLHKVEPTPISNQPTYISDYPYHDEAWDQLASRANEALPSLEIEDE